MGSNITDTFLRSADSTDFKGIDKYSPAKILVAALAGADRPGSANILNQLVEAITFPFDFRKKCSANVELLRSKAAKVSAFGLSISEPIITIIIIANINLAIQDDYVGEF